MSPLDLDEVRQYVEQNISEFHQRKIESLEKLRLKNVLRKKNPYLFRAKNLHGATDIVRAVLDAHVSSNEETIFGNWLEGLAIFINGRVFDGRKSGIQGIDVEFDSEGIRYIVAIKSGPNWGNSGQIKNMLRDFTTAKRILRTSNAKIHVVAVNGCCYGKDDNPDKDEYFKYCGQRFWHFISGSEDLYINLIEPLAHKARERNNEFSQMFDEKITAFTIEFGKDFCDANGKIDWNKLIMFNSGANTLNAAQEGA